MVSAGNTHHYNILFVLAGVIMFILLTGCQKKDAGNAGEAGGKVKTLKTYHDLKSNENLLLGLPVRLKYDDNTRHLFIQDWAKMSIIEIDDGSNVVNVYGGKGKGPGEIQGIDNFFVTHHHLFIVDGNRYLINKYSRQDGHYISSLDYGKLIVKSKNPIHPPLTDINNDPFVTLNEMVLLPTQNSGKFLYKLIDWKGNKRADIGTIPKGYSNKEDNKTYWSALEKKNLPARALNEAFPVNDRSDPENIYLVYSAIPKIAKYSLSGEKIWEHKIPRTPEVDTLVNNLSIRANVVRNHPNVRVQRIPVRKYVTGRSSPDGDLYLVTYTDPAMPAKYHRPVWIHQFNSKGTLVARYKIASDVDLSYYPGIDFRKHKIFATLFKGLDIRTYQF